MFYQTVSGFLFYTRAHSAYVGTKAKSDTNIFVLEGGHLFSEMALALASKSSLTRPTNNLPYLSFATLKTYFKTQETKTAVKMLTQERITPPPPQYNLRHLRPQVEE